MAFSFGFFDIPYVSWAELECAFLASSDLRLYIVPLNRLPLFLLLRLAFVYAVSLF